VVSSEEVVEERGAGAAKVEHACGTGGEAHPHLAGFQLPTGPPTGRRPGRLHPRRGRQSLGAL
jgi:hypothetical protein